MSEQRAADLIIDLRHVTKRFPGVVAMRDMSIQIRRGEIHGLIGENGAGKSTLIKTLTGINSIDEGELYVKGEKCVFRNPMESQAHSIACVYQELSIVPMLSVTDNIFMGHPIKKPHSVLLDYDAMHKRAYEVLKSLGVDVDVKKPCNTFGMGVQQMVEIARAIVLDAEFLIMDEPTSSLGEKEVELLMKSIRSLKEKGITILYISHKLEELFALCDRVTVMRDGEHILTKDTADLTNDELIAAMVGRSVENLFPKIETKRGAEALRAENLCSAGVLRNVSFTAYRGEVLSFAGLVGAGRTETFRAIFGADPLDSGKVYIHGKEVTIRSPRAAIESGLAFLTEDRKGQGLVLSEPIRSNLILASMGRFSKGGVLNYAEANKHCQANMNELKIKAPSIMEPVGKLSGGNQQKVVIGKWLNTEAEIYIFDEPTRGIDVGAKVEVYNIINQLTQAGKCVIMISSELPEILGMSDRVVVMREGAVMAEVERGSAHFNEEDIMKAAWGGNINE